VHEESADGAVLENDDQTVGVVGIGVRADDEIDDVGAEPIVDELDERLAVSLEAPSTITMVRRSYWSRQLTRIASPLFEFSPTARNSISKALTSGTLAYDMAHCLLGDWQMARRRSTLEGPSQRRFAIRDRLYFGPADWSARCPFQGPLDRRPGSPRSVAPPM